MASYSDLVDVSFQDLTAHQTIDGKDVLGVCMPFHWGPVNSLRVFGRTEFYEAYPESLPIGKHIADAGNHFYEAYAQIKRFFENGGAFVEVYRPILESKYQGITKGTYKVVLKYPGAIPAQLLPSKTQSVKLAVTENSVKLIAEVEGSEVVIESWDGQFTDISEAQDGISTHFTKVLESSKFLMCTSDIEVSSAFEECTDGILGNDIDGSDITKLESSLIESLFSDVETSSSTLLISPTVTSDFDSVLVGLGKSLKTANVVIGYPVEAPFTKDSISQSFMSFSDKFTILLAGREKVKLFNEQVLLNCVGGYCGSVSSIASTVRVNQIASAKTYGTYQGVLYKTLSFSDVLALHELGVVSIYSSKVGPQIFGIHNAAYRSTPNSYFSKINVTRVIASLLRSIFPISFEAIHTDTAANPISRAIFESRINSIINDNIAQQNLMSDSYADASAAINTDYLTKGGRELNLVLYLHFIGLVEKVKIKVVATDSSVNAEII